MGSNVTEDRRQAMDEAFSHDDVPATMPAGPQQVTIDDAPRGAMQLKVLRDEKRILQKLKVIANAAGDDFYYRWPVKNKDGTKDWIEGPSVKCTNAVARQYGNCQVRVRAFDMGGHWMLYARFEDLETGFVLERPFQQRKAQDIGGRVDKDRALDIVFQIGVSKATRNVVANALAEYTNYAFLEAKDALVVTVGKELEKYRGRVADRLKALGVDMKLVESRIGRTLDKWLAPDIAATIAEIQACNDGMAHPDDMWPPMADGSARPKQEDFKADEAVPRQIASDEKDDDAEWLKARIAVADKVPEQATLDQMDDEVGSVLTKAQREDDLRSPWNDCYRRNSARIAAMPKAPAKSAPDPADPFTPPKTGKDDLDGYLAELYGDLVKANTTLAVDGIQDKGTNELSGDAALLTHFVKACNAKAAELLRRRKR